MSSENAAFYHAVANGAARVCRLAGDNALIDVRDMETTVMAINSAHLFDFSNCRRLSRGTARRLVRRMVDVDEPTKRYFLSLIDAKEGGAA